MDVSAIGLVYNSVGVAAFDRSGYIMSSCWPMRSASLVTIDLKSSSKPFASEYKFLVDGMLLESLL